MGNRLSRITWAGVAATLCVAGLVGGGGAASATPGDGAPSAFETSELEIARGEATIGFTEIPAPNAPGNCSIAVFVNIPVPPDCTLFSDQFQAPPGSSTIRQASVRTGQATGPMRFTVLRALRSQAGIPSGIICCTAVAQSQVFTPVPNQLNTIAVSLPMLNEVVSINGEPVEVIDYLAISVLDTTSTLPLVATTQGFIRTSVFLPSIPLGQLSILSGAASLPLGGGSAVPTISAVACSDDEDNAEDICRVVGEPGSSFTGLNPSRLLDTRSSGSQVTAGSTTRVQVANAPGVPEGATGAMLNITAVNPEGGGFLTIYPCGENQPTASNVNFVARRTIANAVAATFGAGGEVCVFSSAATHLLVDLTGALTAGFSGLTPQRLLDTRSGARAAAGSTTRVSVADAAGVPGDASGAVLNVTAVNPLSGGFLTIYPCGENQPTASNVNFVARRTIANAAVATFGSGGDVCVFTSAETHLLVDLNGAVSAGFSGVTPNRLLDTRPLGRVGAGSVSRVRVVGAAGVPGDAVAVVLNITAVNPLGGGFLTVFPCGEDQPTASNVNYEAGETIANAAVAAIGTNGEVCIFASAATNLLVDLNGAFS